MQRKIPALLILMAASAAPCDSIAAAAPSIASISPRGASRGQKVVITVEGSGFDGTAEPMLAVSAPPVLLSAAPNEPKPQRIAFELSLSPTDAPGPRVLRVRTDAGLSNPVIFLVGVFPEAAEEEPNDVPDAAKAVPLPITINGSLSSTDRDSFRFSAKAGQRVVFEVEARRIGSSVDPTIHLSTPPGRELAFNDDATGLGVDCRIDHTFAGDGEYIIQVHDAMYLSQPPAFYRLKVGPISYADGVFPLGGRRGSEVLVSFEGGNLGRGMFERVRLDAPTAASWIPLSLPAAVDGGAALPFLMRVGDLPEAIEAARDGPAVQAIERPVTLNGRIERPGEVDRYALAVKPGDRWLFEVEAQALGSHLDAVVQVQSVAGATLASADDNGPSADPRLEFVVPKDIDSLVLTIEDLHRRGGAGFAYRLTARPNLQEFSLALAEPVVSIPAGGTELVAVDAVRRGPDGGYKGPVRLEVVNSPPGFTVRGGTIGAGQARGVLSITAPHGGRPSALELILRGAGEGDIAPAVARATVFLASDRGVPVAPLRDVGLASALAAPLPAALRGEDGPLRVALGQKRTVKLRVVRASGAEGALKLAAVHAPPGLQIAEGMIGEKDGEGSFGVTAAANAPLGPAEAAVRGMGKIGGVGVSLAAPIIAFEIVPPFAIEVAKPAMEASLGSKAELGGLIRREEPFQGDVEVRLEGLPAGMSAPAVTLSASQSAFKLDIASTAPLVPGKVDLKLLASARLGDAKPPAIYSAPPVAVTVTVNGPPTR